MAPWKTFLLSLSHLILKLDATKLGFESNFHYGRNVEIRERRDVISACCMTLTDRIPSQVFYALSTTYQASLLSYFAPQEREVQPSCIVRPSSAKNVATAVSILAANPHCQYAVRGGGHTPFAGSANIEDGITIDLSLMNTVAVYPYLDARSLALSGGRDSTVGVAGLTLGGGISYFSPRVGFVCDGVKSFQVVLANGSIVEASPSRNADLYKALKGGSNNFGIVTSFRLRTFPSGNLWGGTITSPFSTAPQQVAAFLELAKTAGYDPFASLITSFISLSGVPSFVANQFAYTKVPASAQVPPFFKKIASIQPQTSNTLRIASLTNLTAEVAALTTAGPPRRSFSTVSFRNDGGPCMKTLVDLMSATAASITSVQGLVISTSFQPLPQIITSKANQFGANVLGFSPRDGDVINMLIAAQWVLASDDETVGKAVEGAVRSANRRAVELGVDSKRLYLNYADGFQDPVAGYGAQQGAFLRAVSQKYDPDGMFQKQVPGGFKLD